MRLKAQHRSRIISILLLLLVARALIPAGFMPAGNGSAALTLCPNGMLMPADLASTGGVQSHIDHCPFGSAPFAAPIADLAIKPFLAAAINVPGPFASAWVFTSRGERSHQARAPPALSTVI